jgi:hypothetical protein
VPRGELLPKQATTNILPTRTLNKEVLQTTGIAAVDLSLAAQTTAFLQVEVAAILVMPLPEQA